ncbi:MAG: hypothetical protein KGI60_01720 [Patescibacteria group bacterium]|nr:hypothetical protein [Patescibacteria group bacterium]
MTHKETLREAAKFVAGLIAGDLIFGIWLVSGGLLPMQFLGSFITEQTAMLWIIFDLFLLIMLIQYAWHPQILHPSVSQRTLFLAVGFATGAAALAHILRLVFGWQIEIGTLIVPFWLSWIGIFVASYVSYASFHFASER